MDMFYMFHCVKDVTGRVRVKPVMVLGSLKGLGSLEQTPKISDKHIFRFLRFLLYLPPWYKNSNMVTNFGAPDLLNKLKVLHQKLSDSIHFTINPFHDLLKCFLQ